MAGKIKPIEQQRQPSVAVEVTKNLLGFLLSGDIKPGDRLPPERKLAEALGVGRTVLREGLKSLTVLGLVEGRQGDGNYLKATESEFLPRAIEWGMLLGAKVTNDLIESRQVLELSIVRLAAERITDKEIRKLDELMDKMRDADDAAKFARADVAFHLVIVKAARNETLLQIMNNMLSLLKVWTRRVLAEEVDFDELIDQHSGIVEALRAHDQDRAVSAMQAHLESVLSKLQQTVSSTGGNIGGQAN
ncbi:MAG: GntR family transcriptional regulator [Mameliella sp.]|nr:GntR family transcriptional regulator [Mameliella sp.]|tara:strand:+ start:858 stop:1598 length:741 start_codon:yes stop_codon:yes gene_type:complete